MLSYRTDFPHLCRCESAPRHVQNCPDCGGDRYGANSRPCRQLFYFSFLEWQAIMMAMPAFAKEIRHGSVRTRADGLLSDIYDGSAWERIYMSDGRMAQHPASAVLALSTDGFDPFKIGSRSKRQHNLWPIAGVPVNLPPHLRSNIKYVYLATILPHLKGKQRLQPTLNILVDKLIYSYHVGNVVFDAFDGKNVRLHSKLGYVITDLRALHKVETVLQSPSPEGCAVCQIRGIRHALLGAKTLYAHAYTDLSLRHPFRRLASSRVHGVEGMHYLTTPSPLRSEEERRRRAFIGVEVTVRQQHIMKVRERCLLLKLVSTGFQLTDSIGYDPMHTIGGVIRDIFKCLRGDRMTQRLLDFEKTVNGAYADNVMESVDTMSFVLSGRKQRMVEDRLEHVRRHAPIAVRGSMPVRAFTERDKLPMAEIAFISGG